MANYCCAVRTNYFHVKDSEAFRKFMEVVYAEDTIEVWEDEDGDGVPVFAFGCYGMIAGLKGDDEVDDCSYDGFIDGLQKCVADGDAVIIFEAGNEKLRYVIGSATIITSKECDYLDITGMAIRRAQELVGNSVGQTRAYNWKTKVDY